jgi:N-acetylglucosamine malate deacetylase 2
MEQLQQLLGTTIMLVAHPDDEVIAFAGLILRMKKPIVIFATDGAPRDPYFWQNYGSRENYAEVRRQEAQEALGILGVTPIFLSDQVKDGIADQELFRRLPQAIPAFERVIDQNVPDSLLTLAYEGGHPDHDACCFICSQMGQRRKIPVWESPLYHRDKDGGSMVQTFPRISGQEVNCPIEADVLQKKVRMFHAYKSQKLVLDGFRPEIEQFRPMVAYDFTRPPLPWKLNYELWEWKMTGEEVARAFASYLGQGTGDR